MIPECYDDNIKLIEVDDASCHLSPVLGCSPLVAAVLECKKISDPEQAREWLNGDLREYLSHMDLGPGVDETIDRWIKTVNPDHKVLVYGDYDVDGISSTVLAVEMARKAGATVYYYIPDRQSEGYGVHLNVIKRAIAGGFNTILVVDCGSKDVEALHYAKDNGLNVMVFDHHSVDGDVIDLDEFVNPQRGGDIESTRLCATAVLWCWAWKSGLLRKKWLADRIDLVALATVADCMPLGLLNRSLVSHGLDRIHDSCRLGLSYLCKKLDVSVQVIDEESLAMKINPCLNAAGRLDTAEIAVSIMLGDSNMKENVQKLVDLNEKRKSVSNSIAADLTEVIDNRMIHVMYDREWSVGLLSAIASRLCHTYNKAFALASDSGDFIRGTLRVPEGGNAVEILSLLDEELEGWGGHPYAAGFSVSPSKWSSVSQKLNKILSGIVAIESEEKALVYDPVNFDMDQWKELSKVGPFGQGNEAPLFSCLRRGGEKFIPIGNSGLHGKVDIGGISLIAFNGAKQHLVMENIKGWIYRPHINDWKGRTSLQFIVEKIIVAD